MGNFLGCLGILIFGIVILIYGAVRNIYNAAFGSTSKKQGRQSRTQPKGGPTPTDDGYYKKPNRRSGDNRIYPDNVGEYVDYEEVK